MADTPAIKEKYLFIMPSDGEEFLCAIAAIQGLLEEVHKRNITPIALLWCPNHDMEMFVKALDVCAVCSPFELSSAQSRDFDLVFRFDTESAKKIAKATNRSLSQSFSIQLGGAPKALPDLSILALGVTQYDVLLLPWWDYHTLLNMIQLNHPEVSVNVPDRDVVSGEELLNRPQLCRMIVGPRSIDTMIAAAFGRAVVEICPPSQGHREYVAKTELQWYQMIYGEICDVKATLVYKAWEHLWLRSTRPVSSTATVR